MTVTGQEDDAPIGARTDRLGHDDVARHLRARQGRQGVVRELVAMADRDGALVLAPEAGG